MVDLLFEYWAHIFYFMSMATSFYLLNPVHTSVSSHTMSPCLSHLGEFHFLLACLLIKRTFSAYLPNWLRTEKHFWFLLLLYLFNLAYIFYNKNKPSQNAFHFFLWTPTLRFVWNILIAFSRKCDFPVDAA